MSNLKPIEKRAFEDLFDMSSGYVMDFTNATFAEFFRDIANVDIYSERYAITGDSKAKRLRAFLEIETDQSVSRALSELLDIWEYDNDPSGDNRAKYEKCRSIISRLSGKPIPKTETAEDFLGRKIDIPNISKLKVEQNVIPILSSRLDEVEKGLRAGASLSVIFLCGSILEGVLLGTAQNDPKLFNQSSCSPKDKEGNVRRLNEWSLAQLIDVACDLNLIKLDVKKFSHVLRDFRNYIHPYEQMLSGFSPDPHTAEICFQVLKAALADLGKTR